MGAAKDWLSTKQAADAMGCSTETIRRRFRHSLKWRLLWHGRWGYAVPIVALKEWYRDHISSDSADPEVREIQEQIEQLRLGQFALARRLGRLEGRTATQTTIDHSDPPY